MSFKKKRIKFNKLLHGDRVAASESLRDQEANQRLTTATSMTGLRTHGTEGRGSDTRSKS